MRNIYTVYDLKSESIIGSLIMERLDAPAIRAFHDALDPKNQSILAAHPADFVLLCLGSLDDSGVIVPATEPQQIASGAQWAAANFLSEEIAK